MDHATNETPIFTLVGHKSIAKVVNVYDGDSVNLVIEVFGTLYKWKCRLAHVDTPEIKTRNAHEKELGLIARNKLRELIENKIINVECFEFDKYGRLLVEITIPETGVKVHEWLISNNYAKKYEGGTKDKWD